ncbi:MAG TPA: CDP-alcohol phosphatidyltransferase family protein [Steroidobacteraceae bacterium]|jgi:phosphatidylglycerophosphate synthase|nr:CDP-alcohol phosphatidyltransferase family protein [Steroidobacteraceae bacterium]
MDGKPSILEAGGVGIEASAALATRRERGALIWRALLAVLVVGSGMTLSAWLARRQLHFSSEYPWKSLLVFAAGVLLMLPGLPSHHPFARLGAANVVTLVRGALVALLVALVGERRMIAALMATICATLVIVLDGCDGWLARRTRMSSPFGARFDMEIDAALVAVLAVLAWKFGKVPAWVLLSGAMRYLYVAAAGFIPLLQTPLPASYRAKSIAVIQMLALLVAVAPWSSLTLAYAVAIFGLACLTLSFLLDIVWLMRHAV